MNKILKNTQIIENLLGRKTDGPTDPCQPSCAFMMDYKTLESIRFIMDECKHLADNILKINYSERLLITEQERDAYKAVLKLIALIANDQISNLGNHDCCSAAIAKEALEISASKN